jgi:cell division protein FtsI/penicillin-binding protein 2
LVKSQWGEVGVSALQLATAYSAIANDGYLVKPYVIEQIVQSNNEIRVQNNIRVHRKIANENIMKEIKKMLRQVVTGGTGELAELAGWEIAGKTGTAQKYIDGEYSDDKFISNFVGFFPVSNPQILSAIILDEPDRPMHWGGKGAAVAFKRVMKRIINMDDTITPPAKKQKTYATIEKNVSIKQSKKIMNQIPMQLSTKNVKNGIRVPDVRGI